MSDELKLYSYKVEINTWKFLSNNGTIAYVKNVLIILIGKVTGVFSQASWGMLYSSQSTFYILCVNLNSIYQND